MNADEVSFVFLGFLAVGGVVVGLWYIYIGFFHGVLHGKMYLRGLGRMAYGKEAYNQGLIASVIGILSLFSGLGLICFGFVYAKHNPETIANILRVFKGYFQT